MFLLPYSLELGLHIKWENSHISVFFVRLFASLSLFFPSYNMHCLSLQALCDGNCVLLCFFGAKQEAKPAIETCTAIAFKICAVKPILWWTYICLLLKSSIKTNLRAITTVTSSSLPLRLSWYIPNSDSTSSTTDSCPTKKSHPAGLKSCSKLV